MTRKAESLIDIFNFFKPEPLTGEEYAFYQKTATVRDGANYEFHDNLYRRIHMSITNERLLVVGHGGCGKSTELLMLMAKLSKDGTPVVLVKARDDLDLYNFSFIDLFMLIVERMAQYANDNNLHVNEKIISAFQKALSTQKTEKHLNKEVDISLNGSASISAKLPFFLNFIANITSSLRMASGLKEELRLEIKPKIYDIIESLNAFIEDLREQVKHPIVIIIEGLEKCRQECVRKLFVEDIASLSNINAHLVVACPIGVYRSTDAASLSSYFSSPVVIPMIKTHNKDGSLNDDGVNVIRGLVLKRANESFFEEGVLEKIITKAGGSLRDTCYLLSNSAFEADMRNRETIDMKSVDFTLSNFASEVFFRLTSNHYPRAKRIYEGDLRARQDSELVELLYSGAVFEYNGDRWVDLHPLIRDYIKAHPGVLD